MSLSGGWAQMRRIDLGELDMSNMGGWPALVKGVVSALVMLLVLALGYNLYLKDLLLQLDQRRADEAVLKQQFASKARLVANLGPYTEQMKAMETAFDLMLRQLPSDTEVPGLLEDISRTGLGSGLEFEEIKLLPEVVQPFYVELPIQITVTGGYHELATFVSGVAGLPRIVTLHDFEIKPVTPEVGSKLRMNILARTYRYKVPRP
ncbi:MULTISPECIES: type 4a pilus biogenesis protein PilO [Pseudomonas]|jgi:type IV pilus assembly protein PilO|uniref:Type 4a pilus biogenesis protein PilO n=3 Tax=Pseudomonas chlororaphis TaxID=587753 RepID=A0AAP9VVK3_9PSED|nr:MULTISPECIES: type 4a pilus biogenesis protein PilO [Pseudomonas]AIC17609.1 pilus assembly protein PilP [Pseudomonas chlororaphis]AUG38728.1 pilus assembly protein PilP [Pseudomonas chlororaphis]AZD83326.1 Type IV pilus biogenesis protein PilO [Pseudomonas chlororaphis subsp. aureofaciens]AZD89905.1 Type IV pilus biogenesis protein PilO [Pseudomonas chlororaphis subsp. aureofaciens]AZD96356.1 Type IV pilus biogenesis protein PilO [Pseudomonas chlororaphis subsp. aureofaciens]